MLCLSADLTTHALPLFKQAFYPVLKDMKMGGKDDGVKVFNAAKYGSVKVFIVVQERRASRSPSWRRSAAKDGKVTLTDPLDHYVGIGAERFLTLWRGFANGKAHGAERRRH